VILRSEPMVRSILDAADEFEVDLIGMPTAGHHGVLDALRGRATERGATTRTLPGACSAGLRGADECSTACAWEHNSYVFKGRCGWRLTPSPHVHESLFVGSNADHGASRGRRNQL